MAEESDQQEHGEWWMELVKDPPDAMVRAAVAALKGIGPVDVGQARPLGISAVAKAKHIELPEEAASALVDYLEGRYIRLFSAEQESARYLREDKSVKPLADYEWWDDVEADGPRNA